MFVIRTRRPFFRSMPGKYLLMTSLLVVGSVIVLPFTPLGRIFGFVPLPFSFLLIMFGIVVLYVISAEIAKRGFYKTVRA